MTGNRRDSVNGAGWEFAHVAIDDHSKASFVQTYADEREDSAVAFLKAAVAHYAALGVKIKRLLTDNGSAYRSQPSGELCGRSSKTRIGGTGFSRANRRRYGSRANSRNPDEHPGFQ